MQAFDSDVDAKDVRRPVSVQNDAQALPLTKNL